MSIWAKADSEQVCIHIYGSVFAEHIDFLRNNLLERFQYGYRRIILNFDDAGGIEPEGLAMLAYVRNRFAQYGGEMIIRDPNGVVVV